MAGFRQLMSWLNWRRQLMLAALGGWIAVVVVGSGRSPDENWVGIPDLSDLVAFVFVVAVLVGLVTLIFIARNRNAPSSERPKGQVALWVGLAALLLLVATNPDIIERLQFLPEEDSEEAEAVPTGTSSANDGESRPIVTTSAEDLATLAVAVALGAGLMYWTRRRLRLEADAVGLTPSAAETLAPAIEHAAGILRLDGDPRTAVMNAYAHVERAMADHDPRLRRLAWETPSEHIRRALTGRHEQSGSPVRAGGPVEAEPLIDLAELYQRARFSDHAITEDDRTAALSDLEQVRRDLQRSISVG